MPEFALKSQEMPDPIDKDAALHSLYGHSKAKCRAAFGARKAGDVRPQDINTPPLIIQAVLAVWPEGIELDPCSNANSIVPARINMCWPNNGLAIDWPDFTYVNPPYKRINQWLVKAIIGAEHMLLVPVRTNRKWWCVAAKRTTRIAWLKPFAFIGHVQSFPAAVCMMYFGTRVVEFEGTFSELGEVGRFV